tara:strand:+ start:209 stop:565 length:357 start_codon:yes stop_codon:yes gene_type:complete
VADQYLPILIFIFFAVTLSVMILLSSYLFAVKRSYKAKTDPYECGFEPLTMNLSRFDVRFYLIAILFVVFDLEIAFMFPWAISLREIGWPGFFSMMLFLTTVTVGFLYEWCKGALEWE